MNNSQEIKQLILDMKKALDPDKAVEKIDLSKYQLENKSIHIFGLGKASSYQVSAFKKKLSKCGLQENIVQAISYTKNGEELKDPSIVELVGDHPIISKRNIENTKLFINFLKKIDQNDVLFFLLSGGGSALLELPKSGYNLFEIIQQSDELLHSGKSIVQINRERSKWSLVKSGGLLNFIATKNIFQFVTSDIPSEDLSFVSSGPLMSSLVNYVQTIKWQSSTLLLQELSKMNSNRKVGEILDDSLENVIYMLKNSLPQKGEYFITGGEVPISVPKNSPKGGRNMHLCLSLAYELYQDSNNQNISIICVGSDGQDGDTDMAGAYLNYQSFLKEDPKEYLKNFDSYCYFKKTGTGIKRFKTKSNVMDLRCIWRK